MVSKFPPKKNIPGIILSNSSPGPLLRLPSFLARARGKDPPAAWRRLHGKDGWRGLLDPLHPDLRRELVRYDEFVDAAYGAFLSCPDAEPGRHRPRVALPDAAYRVTAPLFATTSAALPAWLSAAAPCAVQRTSLVGYVAVCDSAAEVRHMGRRDIAANIRRRCVAAGGSKTQAAKASATGSGGRDRDDELEKLRCEREALARLRRGQREARTQLLDVERRVRGTERRQERCTAFLARAAGDGEPPPRPWRPIAGSGGGSIPAPTAALDTEADFLAFVVELRTRRDSRRRRSRRDGRCKRRGRTQQDLEEGGSICEIWGKERRPCRVRDGVQATAADRFGG